MYAVIKTGGKQYRVKPDDVLTIERIKGSSGDIVQFGEVLMLAGESGIEVGSPLIAGASVAAELVAHTRGERIIIFKKKRRHHYRRRNGHRQDLSEVRITEILTGGQQPTRTRAAPAEELEAVEDAEPETQTLADTSSASEPAESAAPKPRAKAKESEDDDLSRISGVGAVLVKKLRGEGITTLAQVAALTPEEISALDEKLTLRGRIEREEWVEQARELLAGKPPRAKSDRAADEKSE